ncbi:hypothetical protein QJS10_CPB17g00586 [Acorus calamus]|uniref:Uncharacterized protein n=1 Tax=Acorus calamus TaxID=4465 RepID=A0AAV9CVC8_ACOCL|nr:hypothetical protein QJS10_CPB17g00586 [Acorus calamus]
MTTQRRSGNYHASKWDLRFLQSSFANGQTDHDKHMKRVGELKELVKCMFTVSEPLLKLKLIDDLQRLGLAYHFKEKIRRVLADMEGNVAYDKDDLYATALYFRLLRQYGFTVSQDIFYGFMEDSHNFKGSLRNDTRGLLSLYEASHLAFEGEQILDVARAFTKMHLKNNQDPTLKNQVSHALEMPLQRRLQRLETRWFIEERERGGGDVNPLLLEFAKLDFRMLQVIHRRDLGKLARWWEELGLAKKLSFVRDRLVEAFYPTIGIVPEQQFGYSREGLTKLGTFVTIVDDIYDVYGLLDELELFTDVVDRWDVDAAKILPDYMKTTFLALYNTTDEMVHDIMREEGHNCLPFFKKAWGDICKSFLIEARFQNDGYVPTLEEYLNNAWTSICGPLMLIYLFFSTRQLITAEALQHLDTSSDLIRLASMIFRLRNDLATSKAEIEKGDVATSIYCYMHETGVSEVVAREHILCLIDQMWKKLNKMGCTPSPFPQTYIDVVFDLARMSECFYHYGDGLGAPDAKLMDDISSMLFEDTELVEMTK